MSTIKLSLGLVIFLWALVFGAFSAVVAILYIAYLYNILRAGVTGGDVARAVWPFWRAGRVD